MGCSEQIQKFLLKRVNKEGEEKSLSDHNCASKVTQCTTFDLICNYVQVSVTETKWGFCEGEKYHIRNWVGWTVFLAIVNYRDCLVAVIYAALAQVISKK